MSTYRFHAVVDDDGSVHLSGLPPRQEVEILVLEPSEASEGIQEWLSEVRARHPFAKMDKEEILKLLRQTRETVWAEKRRC